MIEGKLLINKSWIWDDGKNGGITQITHHSEEGERLHHTVVAYGHVRLDVVDVDDDDDDDGDGDDDDDGNDGRVPACQSRIGRGAASSHRSSPMQCRVIGLLGLLGLLRVMRVIG